VTVTVLAAKTAIAALLVAAGGAKLADLGGFAAAVRLFMPGPTGRWSRAVARGIALGEVAVGAASLSSPDVGWLNPVVLAICCGFVAVSAAGYRWHAAQACRCFGALSRRTFNAAGLGRAVLLAGCAALATVPVQPSVTQLSLAGRLALLGGCMLVAGAASAASAATAVLASREAGPRWAS
jgi:hypothetical protein